jgi:RecA/RadA recombinase
MARHKKVVEELPAGPARSPQQKVFGEIAARSKSFRPARETLKRVRAVPTIFPWVDWKLRVGGWPIDRVATVHGPSAAGKTLLCHGLGLSFLRRGHMYCPIDAEMTTPVTWLQTMLGPHVDAGACFASRPLSYEQAVDDVRKVATGLAEARERGKVPPETSCLFVVDSIRKLVPEDIQERIRKMGAEGDRGSVDGFSGAAGRMRAALNSAWLDELVPLMYHTGCAIVFVGRESEDLNADARDRQFGKDWKLTGGRGMYFDSSLVVRVVRDRFVTTGAEESKVVVGERHLVEIHKTKVSAQQDRVEKAWFHTSNGKASPEGFDRARDLLGLADEFGVMRRSGTWLSWGGKRWQGDARFVEHASPELLDELEAALRGKFGEEAAERAEVM